MEDDIRLKYWRTLLPNLPSSEHAGVLGCSPVAPTYSSLSDDLTLTIRQLEKAKIIPQLERH